VRTPRSDRHPPPRLLACPSASEPRDAALRPFFPRPPPNVARLSGPASGKSFHGRWHDRLIPALGARPRRGICSAPRRDRRAPRFSSVTGGCGRSVFSSRRSEGGASPTPGRPRPRLWSGCWRSKASSSARSWRLARLPPERAGYGAASLLGDDEVEENPPALGVPAYGPRVWRPRNAGALRSGPRDGPCARDPPAQRSPALRLRAAR